MTPLRGKAMDHGRCEDCFMWEPGDACATCGTVQRQAEDHGRSTDRCSNCGHVIGAVCSACGREFVCGRLAVPCPVGGCPEGVLPDPDADLTHGPVERPRRA